MSAVSSIWLSVRSFFWALVLPGMLALYVPWRYFGLSRVRIDFLRPDHSAGILVMLAGVVLMVTCIWEFARRGRGTLSPLDPPRRLVVRGLYRYVRNPMYLSATVIILGELLLVRTSALLAYWAVWFAAVNVMVLAYEEPALRRQFGPDYDAYVRAVPRWIPRLR